MRRGRAVALAVLGVLALVPASSEAELPYPLPAVGQDPYDYTQLHIEDGSCDGVAIGQRVPPGSDLPASFDCRETHKLSDYAAVPGDADYDPLVALNPQELLGARGAGTNRAWEITTGRPDVVIAVMDSGIRWDEDRPNLVDKFFLNRGELPVPNGDARGAPLPAYDTNADGRLSVSDYAADPRAVEDPDDENELLDPGDLIRAFSDGVDDDGNGYADDISGWDFFEGDNDPNDDVDYGHGTGESEDSAGEIGIDINPQCPNCSLMETRVGDSFIADVNHFAEATVYAVDNGASVLQSALGTLNHTGFARRAAQYAWERGVLFVASAADEAAGHHNYPSALPFSMVVNSVMPAFSLDDVGVPLPAQVPRTWLSFNGCTNFGGYIWATVASTSCSSDAVGQTAGMAGLVYSAARNAVEEGVIARDRSGQPLSATEARQLFRLGAEDVDFSTPQLPAGLPNNFLTTLPLSQRYITTDGWDQISGWGRLSVDRIVRHIAAGQIPPEADFLAPSWWQPLPSAGELDVVGRVAAPRAGRYTWEVQWAPGVQPPRWPLGDVWRTAASGAGDEPYEGVLATLDLGVLRSALESSPPAYLPTDDPTAPDLPERDAVRLRIVVHAEGDTETSWRTAIDQRQIFVAGDPDLVPGWPRSLDGDGAGSGTFADLDGDGVDELVMADGNGFAHAFGADGTEAPGWPATSDPLATPATGDNGFTRGDIASANGAFLGGSPAVADLDGDGRPEVAAADIEGHLYVWSHDGQRRDGFPVGPERSFSFESRCQVDLGPNCDDDGPDDARDRLNTVERAFLAPPSVGDLDPAHPGLELVAGSNDGHVYAFHADGSPVAGWPVLVRDPSMVAAVDPVTHRVTYWPGVDAYPGRKINTTPSLGDVDGDGDLEVAVSVNESYAEVPDTTDLLPQVIDLLETPGNTRIYLLHHDGAAHAVDTAAATTPHPDDQAYVDGWPVAVAMALLDVLPYVGEGSNGSPVMADVDGDGRLEVHVASVASSPYVFRDDGSPFLGEDSAGHTRTMQSTIPGIGSLATDLPSVAALGGGALGRLGGADETVSFAMGSAGLRRLLDILLPEQQLLAEDHIGVWDPATGLYRPGFPARMSDLQFFSTPAIADVTGDGAAEVLQGSAMYDVRAYSALGIAPAGWPRSTGGWIVAVPAVGDFDGDGFAEVVIPTREGWLFAWRTPAPVCAATTEWPQYQHDPRNTGTYGTDGRAPGVVGEIAAVAGGDGSVALDWSAAGDDGRCGAARAYEVVGASGEVLASVTGTSASVACAGLPVEVRAVDDAGQRGFPSPVPAGACPSVAGAAAAGPATPSSLPATGGEPDLWLIGLLAATATLLRLQAAGRGRRARRR